jgi:hypothetical protein
MKTMHSATSLEREFVAVTDAHVDAAGAQTWWSLTGESDRNALIAEAKARGIEHTPRIVEPETALSRAVRELRGKRRIVRSIRKGKWAVIEESLDISRDMLKHWDGPTIELDKIGRPVLTNATMEEAQQVKESYQHALNVLDTTDLSSWLLDGLQRLNAIGLRKTGGIYYVHPVRMPEWRAYIEVLAVVAPACTVYLIPTIRMTADGAKAILDSLAREVEEEVASVTAEIVGGELGVRGLENRAKESGALLGKVTQYESLLGERMEKLRDLIGKLDVDVAAAKLSAEALKDDAL